MQLRLRRDIKRPRTWKDSLLAHGDLDNNWFFDPDGNRFLLRPAMPPIDANLLLSSSENNITETNLLVASQEPEVCNE